MGQKIVTARVPDTPSPNSNLNGVGAGTPRLFDVQRDSRKEQVLLVRRTCGSKLDLTICLVVLLVLLVSVFILLLSTDNVVSRRIDERFMFRNNPQLLGCRRCRPDSSTSADRSTYHYCCETDQVPTSVDKIVAAKVDEKLQEHLARYGEQRIDANKTLTSNVQCAVHVVLRSQPQTGGSYVTVLGWDDHGQSAFVRQCIHYNRTTGQFRVFQDGLYIITSHLAFDGPSSDVYGQRVMRVRFTEPVLVDLQMGPANDSRRGSAPVHTSVVAGVARLRRNELIYVEAKPVDRLNRGDSGSLSLVKLQHG